MKLSNSTNITYLFLLLIFASILPSDLMAAETTTIENVLCNVLDFITGTIGKGVAAIAVIMIGISLFLGKVSWGLFISTALGIGAIFGAPGLVAVISGEEALKLEDCKSSSSN